jgi:hypothetical protein
MPQIKSELEMESARFRVPSIFPLCSRKIVAKPPEERFNRK